MRAWDRNSVCMSYRPRTLGGKRGKNRARGKPKQECDVCRSLELAWSHKEPCHELYTLSCPPTGARDRRLAVFHFIEYLCISTVSYNRSWFYWKKVEFISVLINQRMPNKPNGLIMLGIHFMWYRMWKVEHNDYKINAKK